MESKSTPTPYLSAFQSQKKINQSIQVFGHGADENANIGDFVNFYSKKSTYKELYRMNAGLMLKTKEYPLIIDQNSSNPQTIAIANSDRSLQLLDIETQKMETFAQKDNHKQKIECLRFKNLSGQLNSQSANDDQKITTLLTASEDKLVKVWDCRAGQKVGQFQYGNLPFFSVDTNGQIVAGGTNEDLIFWDIRKVKVPLEVLDQSHSDDITSIRFHPQPTYHQRVLTCSTDCLVNFFDFSGKASMKEEDDVQEAVYCSEQPLLDCGFIGNKNDKGGEKFFALTSINTVEICHLESEEEAMYFTTIKKFPHKIEYLIGIQLLHDSNGVPEMFIHAGNNQGDVYIYKVDIQKKQEINEKTGEIKEDNIQLVDMIITNQNQKAKKIEEYKQGEVQGMQGVLNVGKKSQKNVILDEEINVVRNSLLMNQGQVCVTTNENNEIQIWRKNQNPEDDLEMGDDDLAAIGGFGNNDDCTMTNEIDLSQFS